jgi:hypothetical protein
MMGTTYLNLTNRLLRRLNEVEISGSDFPSVRGIQATAKDAIQDTIREINHKKPIWPFNAQEHTQVLTVGQEEYQWPSDFNMVDWKSFQIQKDDTLGVSFKRLGYLETDEWYKNYRDIDYDSGTDGRGVPGLVTNNYDLGYAITPSPNQAYTLKYRYYKSPTDLSLFSDEATIPSKFDYVIMAGALYHLNLFKENAEGTQLMEKKFKEGISDMVNNLLPNHVHVFDTRVRR